MQRNRISHESLPWIADSLDALQHIADMIDVGVFELFDFLPGNRGGNGSTCTGTNAVGPTIV